MNILMLTSGSQASEDSLVFAGRLFESLHPTVTVLHVRDNEQHPRGVAERGAALLAPFKLTVTPREPHGSLSAEILNELRENDYHLLVVRARRRDAILPFLTDIALGDTVTKILHQSGISMLVVRDVQPIKHVLIPLDGTPTTEAAVRFWKTLKLTPAPDVMLLMMGMGSALRHFEDDAQSHVRSDVLAAIATIPNPKTARLKQLKQLLESRQTHVHTRLIDESYSAGALATTMKEAHHAYDLVVMAYRGPKTRGDSDQSSQAAALIRSQSVTTLVLRLAEPAAPNKRKQ